MFSLFIVIILCQGERGEKGDSGICPETCISRENSHTNDCLGSHIQLQHLAQSIRQLIIDTKQIANQNARQTSCTCFASSSITITTTVSTRLNQFPIDYNMYMRLKGDKGDKGDAGTSCISNCQQSTQLNIRVFPTIKAAMDAYHDYPDHTYVHIVNEHGRLQSVLIRIHRRLVPLGLETEHAIPLREQVLPTTVSIPKPVGIRFLFLNDGNEVGGSVYQRVNDRLETGVQLAWTAGSNQTRFALASKYQLDSQTVVGAKVNNICQVGLSFQQLLRPGVKLTLSALFEARNLNAGGHKVGFGLELDA
ncbi:unnamed protein product [Rotaria sp. Silwood1]|nr:unnamed protein product [Rotaria sp. Silwood1]